MDADEFFHSPFSENHELVKGDIVPTDFLGTFDGLIIAKFNSIISDFVRENELGMILSNVEFVLAKNPDTVRGANLAFISKSRLAQTGIKEEFYPHPPEFIAEIVSEHKPFEVVKDRVDDFLKSGTEMIWMIQNQRLENDSNITIKVLRNDGTEFIVEQNEEVSGENVIEEFKFSPSKLSKNWLS